MNRLGIGIQAFQQRNALTGKHVHLSGELGKSPHQTLKIVFG